MWCRSGAGHRPATRQACRPRDNWDACVCYTIYLTCCVLVAIANLFIFFSNAFSEQRARPPTQRGVRNSHLRLTSAAFCATVETQHGLHQSQDLPSRTSDWIVPVFQDRKASILCVSALCLPFLFWWGRRWIHRSLSFSGMQILWYSLFLLWLYFDCGFSSMASWPSATPHCRLPNSFVPYIVWPLLLRAPMHILLYISVICN